MSDQEFAAWVKVALAETAPHAQEEACGGVSGSSGAEGGGSADAVSSASSEGTPSSASSSSTAGAGKSFEFTGPLRPGKVTPQMKPPETCESLPDYALHPKGVARSEMLKSARKVIPVMEGADLEMMREVCRQGREVLDIASRFLRVGVTGDEIDRVLYTACKERGLYPSPLNYFRFPKSLCVSVNEIICHGVPDCRPVEDGDIVNLDVSVFINGFHSDLNETFLVGAVDADSKRLVEGAYEALRAASDMIKPGTMYRELGARISDVAAEWSCAVVPAFCGHGIGKLFHGPPDVPHYRRNKAVGVMKPGHVFTIEPMLNAGKSGKHRIWPDDWTAASISGNRSAQFEHTFLVTEDGFEVLTARPGAPTDRVPEYDERAFQR